VQVDESFSESVHAVGKGGKMAVFFTLPAGFQMQRRITERVGKSRFLADDFRLSQLITQEDNDPA
jgi:hypothetical protein